MNARNSSAARPELSSDSILKDSQKEGYVKEVQAFQTKVIIKQTSLRVDERSFFRS